MQDTTAAQTLKLALDLQDAKRAEDRIVAMRRDLEERLAAAVGFAAHLREKGQAAGSKTYVLATPDGAEVKFTLKCAEEHKLDEATWNSVRDQIPAELHPIRVKLEPDMKGFSWLRDNRPETYAVAVRALTSKVGRTSASFKD